MIFKAKVDMFYLSFLVIIALIIALAIFFPLFLTQEVDLTVIIILSSIYIATILFLLWSTFSIKYVFEQDYLFVKGGFLRSQIRYEEITKVTPTRDIYTGYRMMAAKEGIEIFYKTGLFGSVKVAPVDKQAFVEELVKQCPEIEVYK